MPLTDYKPDLCAKFNPSNEFKECERYFPAKNPRECGFCKQPDLYRCLADVGRVIPLSYSSIQNHLTCHHLYYLQNIRGIQTKDAAKSPALKMGTLWDAVLQKHLGGIDRKTNLPFDIPAIIDAYQIEARDVAKVRALYRAYKMLDIQTLPNFTLQAKIDLTIPFDKVWGDNCPVEILVTGYYDRLYLPTCSFVENKLSGSPDRYLDPFFIQSQVGVYFLADPNLLECTMEICRTPDLKSTKTHKDETDEEYGERVYQDILSRPSWYFIGWDSKSKRYGKKYFRNEFNLDELKSRFIHVFREIWEARQFNGWYKNDRSCGAVLPGIKCDMQPVCRFNAMSEDVYQIREKDISFL